MEPETIEFAKIIGGLLFAYFAGYGVASLHYRKVGFGLVEMMLGKTPSAKVPEIHEQKEE